MTNFIYIIFIFSLAIISSIYLVKAFYDLKNRKKHRYGFLIILTGMIIGIGIGITTIITIINFAWTNYLDPYVCLFLATFGAAIIGGLIATIIYGYFGKKYSDKEINTS